MSFEILMITMQAANLALLVAILAVALRRKSKL